MEIRELRKRLQKLEDPRRTDKGNIRRKLEDSIIGLYTIVCNGENFSDMEEFGEQREDWLRGFLELPHGIPGSDTFRRIFERIAPEALSECLYDWLGCHWDEGRVIAIDGKTIRGSKNKSHRAYHVVSAFAAENQLVSGEKDHGRMEKREYYLLTDLSWLEEQRDWPGLKALGMVKSTVTRNDTTSSDTRYFISSVTDLDRFAYAVRKHWTVENQLHWCLDVIFDGDSCRAKKDMSPLNRNVLRKTALALCKHADFGRRISIQKKRFPAALNPDRFLVILFAKF